MASVSTPAGLYTMPELFTPTAYRDLVENLLARGYSVRGYADAEPAQRHLVLRHDIDMSLDAALPIAEIEHALGLKAHYFVLVRTEMYNLFSAHARDALRRLADLGHEIGLHLDASFYNNDPLALQQAAETECTVLEAATGNPVRTISFHRPAKHLLGYADPLAGRVHAYQPRFFAEMGYCSDSRGAWQNGHPLENAAVREGRGLQLLTHPIWWTGVASSLQHRLNEFLVSRMDTFDLALAENCSVHKPGTWRAQFRRGE